MQKLIKLKGKIGKFPIIVGDFNTTLSVIETSRQKIAKNIRRPEKYYQLIWPKTNQNKLQRTETIQGIFSNHKRI